ncbi:MerR family transcriptional regulator [Kitasatospora sp. NPDC053057]|uniref:helix-turn-helix domain-containing protein n=1 Tax=Kitasatospora sp. NPDC053057 TaxID=3364062 RepID=UPI0037C86A5D
MKAVRHYRKLGLVVVPERDSSGHRRYGSGELLRLVQVRTRWCPRVSTASWPGPNTGWTTPSTST